jgi:phospholipid/cholesterol/gamma-HCH transport system substrate-binding protein
MKQNLETKVGIFLMAGIVVICTLILFFGEVGDIFKPTYSLTVKFANASGLLKGSDVYLAGALIGKVTTDPQPIPDTQEVQVHLKINSSVRIRENASYVIGSSGLLGDLYVEVKPVEYGPDVPEDKRAPYVKDGAVIEGATSSSINDLTNSAEPLIKKANDIAAKLDDMITRLNDDVLSGTSTQDLKETIAKLRDMVDNGDSMVKHADELAVQSKSLIGHADNFFEEAENGHGTVSLLLNDRETRDNIRDLIINLKEHGPVFYHDTAATSDEGKKR